MSHFQKLFLPTNESIESYYEKLISLIKGISINWFGFLEDLDGAHQIGELQYGIIVSLIELLTEMELHMENISCLVDKDHYLAIALEDGFSRIVQWSGEEVILNFGLSAVGSDSEQVTAISQSIISDLSQNIPNPMLSNGSLEYIRVLKNWIKVIQQTEISPAVIEDLVLRR